MEKLLNLTVPKDMCPLDFLAEMGQTTEKAWLFLHRSCISDLEQSDGVTIVQGNYNSFILTWEATEEYPETTLVYGRFSPEWHHVISIKADDIAFKELNEIVDPEFLIRLRME